MYYKIGDVSALFGLSTETLRNYERAGLITPRREESYFRCYDMETVRKLVGLRTQRNEGFSIQELQKIYRDISIEEYHSLVREKLNRQKQKVIYETLILEQLQKVESRIADAREGSGQFSQTESPDFYVLPYGLESFIDMKGLYFEQISEWANNLFLVQHMHSFSKDILENSQGGLWEGNRERSQEGTQEGIQGETQEGIQEDTMSMVIERSTAERLGINCDPPVFRMPSQRCVYCNWMKTAKKDVFDSIRGPLREYMESHRLEAAGNPYYISTFTFHEKGEIMSCVDVYVPVELI